MNVFLCKFFIECPSLKDVQRYGSHCYTVHSEEMTFDEASKSCAKKGGYLLEPGPTKEASRNLMDSLRFLKKFQRKFDTSTASMKFYLKNEWFHVILIHIFYSYWKKRRKKKLFHRPSSNSS